MDNEEIVTQIGEHFKIAENMLVANFELANFKSVVEFFAEIAKVVEEQNHHPTITTGYNSLRVETTTHDSANTITQKDVDLAQAISAIYENYETRK